MNTPTFRPDLLQFMDFDPSAAYTVEQWVTHFMDYQLLSSPIMQVMIKAEPTPGMLKRLMVQAHGDADQQRAVNDLLEKMFPNDADVMRAQGPMTLDQMFELAAGALLTMMTQLNEAADDLEADPLAQALADQYRRTEH